MLELIGITHMMDPCHGSGAGSSPAERTILYMYRESPNVHRSNPSFLSRHEIDVSSVGCIETYESRFSGFQRYRRNTLFSSRALKKNRNSRSGISEIPSRS